MNRDMEVEMDIEIAGGVAPGANIAVYYGKDATDKSFYEVVSYAVNDSHNKPNIISISLGSI